ncbi:MAG: hypothetical protein ACLP62_03310 [Acidimicrobiales bacterium]
MNLVGDDDARLWKDVDELFKRRPGWTFLAMSRPGAPPVWCLGTESDPDVSVTVDEGSIQVRVNRTDFDITLASVDDLIAWLNEYRPGSLPERKERATNKKSWRHRFHWE